MVRELFRRAEREVIVVGFAVHQGKRIFEELAHRMDIRESLSVRLYLNIARSPDDSRNASEVLSAFLVHFRQHEWPGRREPEIYYDPRPLDPTTGAKRSCLHAKCVVVDRRYLLVTSANLTEAAQDRNIELGVLLEDERLATRVHEQFGALARSNHLRQAKSNP